MNENTDTSGCGCIGFILSVAIIWALIFGVTWEGVHYDVQCTSDKGLYFTKEEVDE